MEVICVNSQPKSQYHCDFHLLISKFRTLNQGHQGQNVSSQAVLPNKGNGTETTQNNPLLPDDWLNEKKKSYKDWAEKGSLGETYVRCKFCKEDILVQSCYGSHSHQTTKKHGDAAEEERRRNEDDIEGIKMLSKANLTALTKSQAFEYEFIQFIAQKNCSLVLGDDIFDFLKTHIKDSPTPNDVSFYRRKTSILLNEVIKPVIQEDLEEILANRHFSLMIDEGVDKTKTKFLAILVQYWDTKSGLKCGLHSLIQSSHCGNHQELFDFIDTKLLQKEYSRNLVAYASDGASILRGNKNSVLTKLRAKFPLIWDLHCLPHCFHLIANFASDKMPDVIENLVRRIYNHFVISRIPLEDSQIGKNFKRR